MFARKEDSQIGRRIVFSRRQAFIGWRTFTMETDFIIVENNVLYVRVDLKIYSIASLLRVAHKFTGLCYLHLQYEAETVVAVRFRAKGMADDLMHIAGRFTNELLDQTLREVVQQETEGVRNLILAHALSETSLLHPELEHLDPADDVLQIGLPDDDRKSTR